VEAKPQSPSAKPLVATDFSEVVRERFWAKIKKGKKNECWEWQACTDDDGYGIFRHLRAHRVAYAIRRGGTPTNRLVCHRCDNPPCCNPAHLFLGTYQSNKADCVAKKRHVFGDRCWQRRYPWMVPRGDVWRKKNKHRNTATGDRNGSRVHIERMPRGMGHCKSKLTDSDVVRIRRLRSEGWLYRELADEFGIWKGTAHQVVNSKTWKHIT